jgi:ATP-dependent 26S proteasome regulatory subunit
MTAEQMGALSEYMSLARLLQPSIVVIEDVDLIARSRGTHDNPCTEALLNKLLNEMDGLKEDAEIVFILTTNRPHDLEQALAARPGRIDQSIEFHYPDAEGRRRLVRLYAREASVSATAEEMMIRETEEVGGAFIKELVRRALLFHLERADENVIDEIDVQAAVDELLHRGGEINARSLGAPQGFSARAQSSDALAMDGRPARAK